VFVRSDLWSRKLRHKLLLGKILLYKRGCLHAFTSNREVLENAPQFCLPPGGHIDSEAGKAIFHIALDRRSRN
jgi:hypothetical protein